MGSKGKGKLELPNKKNKGKEKATNGEENGQEPAKTEWRFDDTDEDKKTHKAGLEDGEREKYDKFKHNLNNEGMTPFEAAKDAGVTHYKPLQGTRTNEFQGRLSLGERVTTEHVEETDPETGEKRGVVRLVQLGGHTKKKKK